MFRELKLDISFAIIICFSKEGEQSRYHCMDKNSKTGWRRFAGVIEEAASGPEKIST